LVAKAVTVAKPRPGNKIGVAARLMPALYRLLPNRWWDGFMAQQFRWTDHFGQSPTPPDFRPRQGFRKTLRRC